jgi:CDGSH-type Zn-finger protein
MRSTTCGRSWRSARTTPEPVVIKVRDRGPYKVTGPVTVVDAEGKAFALPDGPIALCRCGASATKPFCDASHRGAGFEACDRA